MEIARALARQPKLVVLDEATSALDPIVEQKVLASLVDSGAGLLIIAHRLSSVLAHDEIIFLDHGEVVERGTHDDDLVEAVQRSRSGILDMRYPGLAQSTGSDIIDSLLICAQSLGASVLPARIAQAQRLRSTDPQDVAQQLHLPIRVLQCEGDWWKGDSGPYLLECEDGRYAAAVPTPRSYDAAGELAGLRDSCVPLTSRSQTARQETSSNQRSSRSRYTSTVSSPVRGAICAGTPPDTLACSHYHHVPEWRGHWRRDTTARANA